MTSLYLCCRPPYPKIYSNEDVTSCCCLRCYEVSLSHQKQLYPLEIPVIHTHSTRVTLNILHCVYCGLRLFNLRSADSCTLCRLNVLFQELSLRFDQWVIALKRLRHQTKDLTEEEKGQVLLEPTDLTHDRSRSVSPTTFIDIKTDSWTPTKEELDEILTEDEDSDTEPHKEKSHSSELQQLSLDTFPAFLRKLDTIRSDNSSENTTLDQKQMTNPDN